MIANNYENYHKHSYYSNISTPDCIISPKDLAERAIELDQECLVTTEHGYAGSVFEYYKVAKEYGLRLIYGIEYYYVPDRHVNDKSNAHLMILAKNKEGIREMNSIMSEASKTGYYGKPRIDNELLFSLTPENVVVTSTCIISPFGKGVLGNCKYNKYENYESEFIVPLHKHFGENFYLEIHDNTHEMQVKVNRELLNMHNKYGIPLIHATDTHYIHPEDDKDRTDFLRGKDIWYPEEEGFIMDYPHIDTIRERYKEQGVFDEEQVEQSLNNTNIIKKFEVVELDDDVKMPTIYPDKSIDEKHDILKNIIKKEWNEDKKEISEDRIQAHKEAIKEEFEIITGTSEVNTVDYFLLNYEIIRRAKKVYDGVLTRTGRGSAPSFYINKLLGFTEIDRVDAPIPLYPTRFMSKSRILEARSMPDVDFNTSDPDPFVKATKDVLGEDNAYVMMAYGTMQESEAFRNLCRAKEMELIDYNEIAKDLDRYKNNPKWKDLIQESKKFIGVIDSVSPHPCAYLVYDKSISENVGVYKVGGELCSVITSDESDDWKYLKEDFLTVTVWDIIAGVCKRVGKPIPDIRELNSLIDDKVWEMYREGLTATLNQSGTDSGTPQVVQYKPKTVGEMSAWVAAIRPSFASMKETFLNRKEFHYGIEEFDKLLESSQNFVLFQENIMSTLIFAGFKEDETYGLLKAISKKKEGVVDKVKDKFIKGFTDKTGSEENAYKVWQIIEDASGYGFNSSHALSVAYDSVYGAYLKANYPLDYYAYVLNKYEDDTDMTNKIYKELPYFGIKVLPIEFGKSQAYYTTVPKENSVVKGTKSIKYLNVQNATELMDVYNRNHKDLLSLFVDVLENTSVDARQMKILIQLNFFKKFGENKYVLDVYGKFLERYKKTHIDKTKEKRLAEIREYAKTLKNEPLPLKDQLFFEREYLGYIQTTFPKRKKSVGIILDIDKRRTPKIYLYMLKTGKEVMVKADKKRFYDKNNNDRLRIGDILDITKVEKKGRWGKIDGKWKQSKTEMENYIGSCKILKK